MNHENQERASAPAEQHGIEKILPTWEPSSGETLLRGCWEMRLRQVPEYYSEEETLASDWTQHVRREDARPGLRNAVAAELAHFGMQSQRVGDSGYFVHVSGSFSDSQSYKGELRRELLRIRLQDLKLKMIPAWRIAHQVYAADNHHHGRTLLKIISFLSGGTP